MLASAAALLMLQVSSESTVDPRPPTSWADHLFDAEQALHEGRLSDGLAALEAAREQSAGVAAVAYGFARWAALSGAPASSVLDHLEEARKLGWSYPTVVTGDASFAAIRDDPRFRSLTERMTTEIGSPVVGRVAVESTTRSRVVDVARSDSSVPLEFLLRCDGDVVLVDPAGDVWKSVIGTRRKGHRLVAEKVVPSATGGRVAVEWSDGLVQTHSAAGGPAIGSFERWEEDVRPKWARPSLRATTFWLGGESALVSWASTEPPRVWSASGELLDEFSPWPSTEVGHRDATLGCHAGGTVVVGGIGGAFVLGSPLRSSQEWSLDIEGSVAAIALAPDGDRVAVSLGLDRRPNEAVEEASIATNLDGAVRGEVRVYCTATGRLLWSTRSLHTGFVSEGLGRELSFSPDGSKLACGLAKTFGVAVWEVDTGHQLLIQDLLYGRMASGTPLRWLDEDRLQADFRWVWDFSDAATGSVSLEEVSIDPGMDDVLLADDGVVVRMLRTGHIRAQRHATLLVYREQRDQEWRPLLDDPRARRLIDPFVARAIISGFEVAPALVSWRR